ncbi:carbamoyl-phosphate synthase large subunit [bacterium]|nr:carbamoyl-phosphate synthase large subunit [bacterium]
MKQKKDLPFKTVLVIGSGPIVIGQACEFDYSGTQACKALKEEGLKVILLNSNPATIMTDPSVADRTYIEPVDPMTAIQIIRKEGVDAILPTMGGQTALNLITALSKIPNALDNIHVIGANLKAIHLAEDRRAFRELLETMGLDTPRSSIIRSLEECKDFANEIGFPFILRPSFTMGGTGQSLVYNADELAEKVAKALQESPIEEALVEEGILGWKEYELEVMRDHQDNAIVVCSIENLDPMGIHTGDSITVAPAQTLTDREYQDMRRDSLELLRRVGVETGGCNVQFAVDPKTGRRIVIEMNPRVSRSSALASKATGFPIAYVATKLALGYALSEIDNNITKSTKACFEPPIDYVALKIPRFHFEKFVGTSDLLTPQMKSVGEVLALGASLGEAFHKALNGLERKWPIFEPVDSANPVEAWRQEAGPLLKAAHARRGYVIWDALATGLPVEDIAGYTGWDPWFLNKIREYQIRNNYGPRSLEFKNEARFEMIDSCSAETRATTPFYYSTFEKLSRSDWAKENLNIFWEKPPIDPASRGRVVILGSGPNRIGQGIEFDYCCVHASKSLQSLGFETIMVNCNPETVSTDPQTSTRLYLEPLHEDMVKQILERELDPVKEIGGEAYVLLQMGGQTPLKLSHKVQEWGYKVLGTTPEAIDLSEDRLQFANLLKKLDIPAPQSVVVTNWEEARQEVEKMGYPVLLRPSFVLGGQAMKICANEKELSSAFAEAKEVSGDFPLYIDRFLSDAVEFDIDGICDGKSAWIGGVMEHVEEAGIHSGDSTCVIPPLKLPPAKIDEMAGLAKKIAVALEVKGLFNIQMAVLGEQIFVLEANPRASRTVPFLSKATGYPMILWSLRAALGEDVKRVVDADLIPGNYRLPGHGFAVKAPVFPFNKFQGFDPVLGPEMRSTGEVMGMDVAAGPALAKAFLAAGMNLPMSGKVLFSVRDQDKQRSLNLARVFDLLGFELMGTPGTAEYLERSGLDCQSVSKIGQSVMGGDDLLTLIKEKRVSLVINTTGAAATLRDATNIRMAALQYRVPLLSTLSGAEMMSMAIQSLQKKGRLKVMALQDFILAREKRDKMLRKKAEIEGLLSH